MPQVCYVVESVVKKNGLVVWVDVKKHRFSEDRNEPMPAKKVNYVNYGSREFLLELLTWTDNVYGLDQSQSVPKLQSRSKKLKLVEIDGEQYIHAVVADASPSIAKIKADVGLDEQYNLKLNYAKDLPDLNF